MSIRTYRQYMATVAACAAMTFIPMQSWATENGSTEYPIGVDSVDVALTPPPGTGLLLNYNTYLSGKIYGNNRPVSGTEVHVFVSALRGLYTWPVSFDDNKLTLSTEVVIGGGNLGVNAPGLSQNSTGITDPAFFPLTLNYHNGPLFISGGVAFWAPLGTYNKSAPLVKGLGENHWTFAPLIFTTYKFAPNLQLDATSVTEFNTINPATHYYSGSDETVTAALSYSATPKIQIGAVGYLYEQFTNDTQSGMIVNKGNRGQVLGLGVHGVYNIGHGGIVLTYYHDTLVRNRPGGDQVWLQWALPID